MSRSLGKPATPPRSDERARTYSGDANEEVRAIVAATYRVIERAGTVEPTMRDILSEAQLSTPAFYRHFKGKDDLLITIIEESCGRLMQRVSARMDRRKTAPSKIGAWVSGIVGQAADLDVAAQVRPFAVNFERLAALYPATHRSTTLLMTDPIIEPVIELTGFRPARARDESIVVLRLVVAVMQMHLCDRTQPTKTELDRLATFIVTGLVGLAAS
ncbi:MAG: TetR/AcrR family transcriptional regulator [Acidimicrobiia bacterium]